MFEKIKKLLKHPLIKEFRDVRVMGLVVFGVIVLLVSWSGLQVIEANYQLQQQIAHLEQQTQVTELENNNLKLSNQYYNTDQYLELQARRQFGKGAPGEKLLLVPKSVALAHTVDIPDSTKAAAKQKPPKPSYQRNFESWMSFFFHRSLESDS
jgi:cell division protein FtsB